ncbi:large ribosomal subunit protein uL23-like [Tenrec ecaudatus]|uniref:large ribosomal subunit protein uL23-like n=1 Tax=Tenrec ecaudatus TaxID=94439 RepID=UPI003F5A3713
MAPKATKEAPAPPKTEAKAQALKAKKAVLKRSRSHTPKEDPPVTHLPASQDPGTKKAARIPLEERPQEKQAGPLCHHVPLDHRSAMKKMEEHNTPVLIVDAKANKRQIKQAGK